MGKRAKVALSNDDITRVVFTIAPEIQEDGEDYAISAPHFPIAGACAIISVLRSLLIVDPKK